MEGFVDKKKELIKKLPRAKSVDPSAPMAEAIAKVSGEMKSQVDVHSPRYVDRPLHKHMTCSKKNPE